jgi:hypothetical protein
MKIAPIAALSLFITISGEQQGQGQYAPPISTREYDGHCETPAPSHHKRRSEIKKSANTGQHVLSAFDANGNPSRLPGKVRTRLNRRRF